MKGDYEGDCQQQGYDSESAECDSSVSADFDLASEVVSEPMSHNANFDLHSVMSESSESQSGRRMRARLPSHTAISEEALSSSSNYMNILHGNTSELYSPEITEEVQSKRVAHRVSEKKRRDRLTAAIRKMETLLPADRNRVFRDRSGKSTGICLNTASQYRGSSSKVAVVEIAIRYIQELKQIEKEAMKRKREEERQNGQRNKKTSS
jgi:hypothetical protein